MQREVVSSQRRPGMDRCPHFDLGEVIHTVLRLAGREIFTNTRTIQAPDEEEGAPPQRTGVLEKGGAAKALVLAKLPYVTVMLCITTRFHVHAKPVDEHFNRVLHSTICFLETKMHSPRVWSTVCDEPRRVRFLNMSVIQHIRV